MVKPAEFTPPFHAGQLADDGTLYNDTVEFVFDSQRNVVSYHGDVYGRYADRVLRRNVKAAQRMAALLNKLHGLPPTSDPAPFK